MALTESEFDAKVKEVAATLPNSTSYPAGTDGVDMAFESPKMVVARQTVLAQYGPPVPDNPPSSHPPEHPTGAVNDPDDPWSWEGTDFSD